MLDRLSALIGTLQTWLFEQVVQPALFHLGLISLDEVAFGATEWFILGAIEVLVLYALLRPLEAWRPVERWPDRRGVGTDVVYTLLHRLGVVPLLSFALLTPIADSIEAWTRLHGFLPFNVEGWFAAADEQPLASFVVYLLVLDLAEYLRHRLQHRLDAWWGLHALHHSQRRMTFWTDDRNHLLDDLLQACWLATLAILIGVSPAQFAGIILFIRAIESLSHANVDIGFGWLGERLIVGPRFHRLHHAIGAGHEGAQRGCNFAVLFPVWDIVFGTARWVGTPGATGIRDQLDGRDYGCGFWRQQWLGLERAWTGLIGKRARSV
jgi:sterol desaturase/sphingolipid hydroxylase (fatty acid hydroxylase superfamily)